MQINFPELLCHLICDTDAQKKKILPGNRSEIQSVTCYEDVRRGRGLAPLIIDLGTRRW